MRNRAILLCASLMIAKTHAQSLTDADREALLGNLEKLREAATSRVDGKYRVALNAFRSAMSSDDQAIELYLNCYERVNFEDKEKKAQDFREWKRKEADKLSDPAFKKALRLQLSWLVLTLQAAAEKPDMPKLAKEAEEITDTIFREADKLASQQQVLEQAATASVFARAYEINHAKVENWPGSPTQLEQIYDQVVFPPLHTPGHLPALRAAWLKRIQQESAKRQFWGADREGRRGGGPPPSGPDYEKFLAEGVPQLQWEMEVDLFNHGDEGGAALRMLALIEKNITHPSAREWGEQFKTLLKPKAAPATPATANAAP